ncbi:MAG: glycosyltransferase family 2 protein [candidate division KSB1 bacterium]|nr:glycosyltransferase family 2 protein [candidate division KSB1 bacterium]MDZ7346361.1 glycosyltransferase family 2 protein [candidate division KSB1 bacterium]
MEGKPKTLIALPAYNEANHIVACLKDISVHHPLAHVLVVDDGSVDATAERAADCRARVVRHPHNFGKAAAILTALNIARQEGYEWILFMDSDGQHPAQALPNFFRAMRSGLDAVLANRIDRRTMPLHRQLSNGITSILVSLTGGRRIHDSQCGMRAFRVDSLVGLPLREKGFQLESELLIRLGRKSAVFNEIPIATIYTGQKSSIRPGADTLRFILLILKTFWW